MLWAYRLAAMLGILVVLGGISDNIGVVANMASSSYLLGIEQLIRPCE